MVLTIQSKSKVCKKLCTLFIEKLIIGLFAIDTFNTSTYFLFVESNSFIQFFISVSFECGIFHHYIFLFASMFLDGLYKIFEKLSRSHKNIFDKMS